MNAEQLTSAEEAERLELVKSTLGAEIDPRFRATSRGWVPKTEAVNATMQAVVDGRKTHVSDPRPQRRTLLADVDEYFAEESAASRSSWQSVDLRDHMGRPDDGRDAPTLLKRTDGLTFFFYPGKRNEVHGPSEAGKSWIALVAVKEVIELGGKAVWIDYEDTPRAVLMRLLALGARPSDR